jgi:hypothetical protein
MPNRDKNRADCPFEAVDSAIKSFRRGELDEWELRLIRTRLEDYLDAAPQVTGGELPAKAKAMDQAPADAAVPSYLADLIASSIKGRAEDMPWAVGGLTVAEWREVVAALKRAVPREAEAGAVQETTGAPAGLRAGPGDEVNHAMLIPPGMYYFSFYCENFDAVQCVRVGATAPRRFTFGVTGIDQSPATSGSNKNG